MKRLVELKKLCNEVKDKSDLSRGERIVILTYMPLLIAALEQLLEVLHVNNNVTYNDDMLWNIRDEAIDIINGNGLHNE